MSRYSGMTCIVCDKKFVVGDDIVVCPDCGLPHHRQCYNNLGHCAMADKHGTAEQWTSVEAVIEEEVVTTTPKSDTVICPKCSHVNPSDNLFCDKCGADLHTEVDEKDTETEDLLKTISSLSNSEVKRGSLGPLQLVSLLPNFDDSEMIDGISVKELKLFLGKNFYYFMSHFRFMKKGRVGISLNISASIGNFIYYFYRKMYSMGFLMIFLSMLYYIPFAIYFSTTMGMAGFTQFAISMPRYISFLERYVNVANKLSIVVTLFNGIFFNRIYKKYVYKKITFIKTKNLSNEQYETELAKKGGVNPVMATVLMVVFLVLSVVIVSYLYGML